MGGGQEQPRKGVQASLTQEPPIICRLAVMVSERLAKPSIRNDMWVQSPQSAVSTMDYVELKEYK